MRETDKEKGNKKRETQGERRENGAERDKEQPPGHLEDLIVKYKLMGTSVLRRFLLSQRQHLFLPLSSRIRA